MWPWEHLAVGYIGYSLVVRLLARRAPGDAAVVALALGTQFPDLVDKPLAWVLGILPSGYSLGHSLFVAAPLSALVITAAWGLRRTEIGAAFAFGYLSHLPGDVFYSLLVGSDAAYSVVLWPVVPAGDSGATVNLVAKVRELFGRYVAELASGEVGTYLAVELGLFASVVALWVLDGMPPLRAAWSWLVRSKPVEETP
ncbi:metal-dependent hydrolase [Halorussus litoreus]|uniref:metal-dependent hydrolase n=1 Tax=Halorussus litoreus TaxID=1710536 RepID=UPI000E287C96|nr:metal-dependent hydrolase [Halorussus litoreus]